MSFKTTVAFVAQVLAIVIGFGGGLAKADEIRVIAANASKDAIGELMAGFEKASGHKVVASWGGTDGIERRIGGGEVFDVVIIAAPNIDKLIAQGKLASGSRTNIARSGVGIAVRSGLPKPDISTAEAVKAAVLQARSVAYSSGPSGHYIVDLFTRMGIAEQVKGKVRQPPSGSQIAELLARGEADLGFQQISELLHAAGVDYLGPLPAEIQNVTIYAAGLHAAAPSAEAARALVRHLTSPDSAASIRKVGMEPG